MSTKKLNTLLNKVCPVGKELHRLAENAEYMSAVILYNGTQHTDAEHSRADDAKYLCHLCKSLEYVECFLNLLKCFHYVFSFV